MKRLDDYEKIVGSNVINKIREKARKLYGYHIVHINSTYQGGGVAEILNTLVPLMNDVGIDAGWRILNGTPDFFTVTKKFHNALQGGKIRLTKLKKKLYTQANEEFSSYTHIRHDCVIIHDPQPLPLIEFYKKRQPWIWRCHVDLSTPNMEIWKYLRNFILKYDMVIISNKKYRKKDIPLEQRVIYPAIDPLSPKNEEISEKVIDKYLHKFGIERDKPIITQISRFDRWKDPEGVLEVFKLVKKKIDSRLVLCGSMAPDDPEAQKVYEKIKKKANNLVEKGDVTLVISENNILVNALQRVSSVIIQKSLKEGFGLTVSEALWKGTPVVASNVGGIPLQIKNGENGFLVNPYDNVGFANRVIKILKNPKLGKEMGKKGKEFVRKNHLITRLLSDYLDVLRDVKRL